MQLLIERMHDDKKTPYKTPLNEWGKWKQMLVILDITTNISDYLDLYKRCHANFSVTCTCFKHNSTWFIDTSWQKIQKATDQTKPVHSVLTDPNQVTGNFNSLRSCCYLQACALHLSVCNTVYLTVTCTFLWHVHSLVCCSHSIVFQVNILIK